MQISYGRWIAGPAFLLIVTTSIISYGQESYAAEPPRVVSAVAPPYPMHRKLFSRSNGKAEVEVTIDSQGHVRGAHATPGPAPDLNEVAEAVAKHWLFLPASDTNLRTVVLEFVFTRLPYGQEGEDVAVFHPPYQVEVLYHPLLSEPDIIRLPRILGQVIKKTCPVHDEALKLDVVPIRYGAYSNGPDYRTRAGLFPESHKDYEGGCIRWGMQKAEVLYCQKCRAAEEAWWADRFLDTMYPRVLDPMYRELWYK